MIKEAPPLVDILNWDISNWSEAFTFWDHRISFIPGNLKCLELGSREGGLSLWLAAKGHHVICTDLNGDFTKAQALHKRYHVSHLVNYQNIDTTNIPYENEFDVVVFKSMLGAVGIQEGKELQRKAISEIWKAMKPGGIFLFAENLRSTRLHNYLRTKFTSWGEAWRYINREEMEEFLHEFRDIEMHSNGFLGTLGRNENQRSILGNFDRIMFDKIVPANWKYILYGYAIK